MSRDHLEPPEQGWHIVSAGEDSGADEDDDAAFARRLQAEEEEEAAMAGASDEELARRLQQQQRTPPLSRARRQPDPVALPTMATLLGSVMQSFTRFHTQQSAPPPPRRFRNRLQAYSALAAGLSVAPDFECGDKLLLPVSCLHELSGRNLLEEGQPTLFRVTSPNSDGTTALVHGGVLEFTAPPECVVLPTWMMGHLGVDDGGAVMVEHVTLPAAKFVRLRPVNYQEFKQLRDQRAALESSLRAFFTLTKGTTITVPCQGVDYIFEVVDTQPADAVCILNTDVETEFELHDDYFAPVAVPASPVSDSAGAVAALNTPEGFRMPGHTLQSSERPADSVECASCAKWVPQASYQRHLAFCSRNVFVCPDCGARMQKSEQDAHFARVHAPVECRACGSVCPQDMLATHVEFECDRRPLDCEWCRLSFAAREHAKHVELCGARTDKCTACGVYVMLRDMARHAASGCKFTSIRSVGPAASDLFVCELCETPFLSEAELASHAYDAHTDEGAALRLLAEHEEAQAALRAMQGSDAVFHCPHCKAPFFEFALLDEHVAREHPTMDGSGSDFEVAEVDHMSLSNSADEDE